MLTQHIVTVTSDARVCHRQSLSTHCAENNCNIIVNVFICKSPLDDVVLKLDGIRLHSCKRGVNIRVRMILLL